MSDVRQFIFKIRSYTPLPFLLLMVLFARPTQVSILVGLVIVLAGELIRFWGVSIAGSETRTTGSVGGTFLITTGPFAYVRNPLYVGNILIYTGVGVMSLALFPWLPMIAAGWFILQYSLIVSREEEYLSETFRHEYARYREQVPRFFPRFTPFRSPDPAVKSVNLRAGISSERRTLQALVLVTMTIMGIYLYQQWLA